MIGGGGHDKTISKWLWVVNRKLRTFAQDLSRIGLRSTCTIHELIKRLQLPIGGFNISRYFRYGSTGIAAPESAGQHLMNLGCLSAAPWRLF